MLICLALNLLKTCMLDDDFGEVFILCEKGPNGKYYLHDQFLFKEGKLFVVKISLLFLFVKEVHDGGLMGRFVISKTYDI